MIIPMVVTGGSGCFFKLWVVDWEAEQEEADNKEKDGADGVAKQGKVVQKYFHDREGEQDYWEVA